MATISDPKPILKLSQPCEITDVADAFIGKQKQSVKYRQEILLIADRITGFLSAKGIDAETCVDLFTDPEYSNWSEPKIQITVNKDALEKAYALFDEVLEFSFKGITQKTLKRLLVTIDSR
jgi:hypothetical protein